MANPNLTPVNAVIIDDEQDSRDALQLMLETFCPSVAVIGVADSVASGHRLLSDLSPDLVFLDIEMRDGNGFELLNQFASKKTTGFKVIFVTGYDNYAVKAFKYLAIDYLMKPVDPDDLQDAIQKVADSLRYDAVQSEVFEQIARKEDPDRLVVPGLNHHRVLRFDEISVISANGNYVFFKLTDQSQHLASRNLMYYEQWLPSNIFFRVHKSHIVNLNHVRDINSGGDRRVTLTNDLEVPLSVRKMPLLMKLLRGGAL